MQTDRVASRARHRGWDRHSVAYALAGVLFGVTLVKGEIVSWFRIQEMFRFQAFHMYGVIGTAVITGAIALAVVRRFGIRTIDGAAIVLPPKRFHAGQVLGGVLFGIGWAITGACPGPLYAQLGAGSLSAGIILLSAIGGTWLAARFVRETGEECGAEGFAESTTAPSTLLRNAKGRRAGIRSVLLGRRNAATAGDAHA